MDGLTPVAAPRWQPPRLEAAAVDRLLLLARRRAPWVLPGGVGVTLAPLPDTVDGPVMQADGAAGAMLVQASPAVFDALLASLDPAAAGQRNDAGALLTEAALEPLLGSIERAIGPVSLTRLQADMPASDAQPWALGLGFALADATLHAGRIALPPAAEQLLLRLHAAQPIARRPVGHLVVGVAIRLGMAELTLTELRGLVPGDAIVPDRTVLPQLAVVAGETVAWRAACTVQGVVAAQPRGRAGDVGLQEWIMSQTAPPAEAATLDEIPIRLAFELGRVEMTVAELASVGPGHVVPLALDPRTGPVDVIANGRRIGRGEIIEVNGALAIRIVSLAVA